MSGVSAAGCCVISSLASRTAGCYCWKVDQCLLPFHLELSFRVIGGVTCCLPEAFKADSLPTGKLVCTKLIVDLLIENRPALDIWSCCILVFL